VLNYEAMTGKTVDMDKNAIAAALKRLAEEQSKLLIPLQAEAKAHHLPVLAQLAEWQSRLSAVQSGPVDDCVRALAGEGASLKEQQGQLHQLHEMLDEAGLAVIRRARLAANQMAPLLEARGENGELAAAASALREMLASETFYESMAAIQAHAQGIAAVYSEAYTALHDRRSEDYGTAIEAVKGSPDWASVPGDMQGPILTPLLKRACSEVDMPADAMVCRRCGASLDQLESDQAALAGLQAQALARIAEIVRPPMPATKVRLAQFFPSSPTSPEVIEEAIKQLRAYLLELIDEKVVILFE
jgi:hypothetical protein